MSQSSTTEKFLKDYAPSPFEIESVYLTFDLSPHATQVTNKMKIRKLEDQNQLVLDGEHLKLVAVRVDGNLLTSDAFHCDDKSLTLTLEKTVCEVEIVTEIDPENNTRLEGLYRSSGNFCTQCEAEGFRTISYFLDRPDVLTYFTTKIVADRNQNPVLLSNGNLIESGQLDEQKHFCVWEDPFKKPCYLFALVAGNLSVVEDHFVTKSGRRVDLRLYVEPQNLNKTAHAMQSLKYAMAWDEEKYGLEYDLSVYMIVAVDDFNMGAMENKGLNIFNSKYVLADPETATDTDYEGIEAVIAHEYFHNWTGNRVTCRDWFQLTLKEGLTVFRDQQFTADRLAPAVKRIEDVKRLRSYQFPEDAGPMAHPIQPQSYIEMNNFYTMTVYEKGSEVVRMYHTWLGDTGFRKGMDLYFDRFDGQAVTVHDFRNAMADANQTSLESMKAWYTQAGTPVVKITKHYDSESQTLTLKGSQWLKGAQTHDPFPIPIKFGMLSAQGEVLSADVVEGETISSQEGDAEWLLLLKDYEQTWVFSELEENPCLSLLRGFSAPVILEYSADAQELSTLAAYDVDAFVQWESMQALALTQLSALVENSNVNTVKTMALMSDFDQAFQKVLMQENDPALKAYAMSLPEDHYFIEYLHEKQRPVNIDIIDQAQAHVHQLLGEKYKAELIALYDRLNVKEDYVFNKSAKGGRLLKNRCLHYLAQVEGEQQRVYDQYWDQQNMTDVAAALSAMKYEESDQKAACFEDFYQRWHTQPLVLDKWFALQSADTSGDPLERVKSLVSHSDFSYKNPNRVRSVLGVFGRMNLKGFHREDGLGYEFLADQILTLDAINPQVAARMVSPFTQWKKLDSVRQSLMKQALHRIASQDTLSKDVYEIVSKSLKDESNA